MSNDRIKQLFLNHVRENNHSESDYFPLIKELVAMRNALPQDSPEATEIAAAIGKAYTLVEDEIITSSKPPRQEISFGTSGWRGIIGKDLNLHSVGLVTQAIIDMYRNLDQDSGLAADLGVRSFAEAQKRGAVVGFDNRFGGSLLAERVVQVLSGNGISVHYAREATTGTLSAAVLVLQAAFSINLTPSHNPLEYGGFKFNAADAGPAATPVTNAITENARRLALANKAIPFSTEQGVSKPCNALACWQELVGRGKNLHGLDYPEIIRRFHADEDCVVVIDCVHGASRVHMKALFGNRESGRLILLRDTADPTFGGVAPEPSSQNMQQVLATLRKRPETKKLGAIIDPDADRIRFTDGTVEIDMNFFGAMAFHYLHEKKGKKGLVAKTVATSNFANAIAGALGEKVFEPRVGFKEFKPVIGKALICFEESDGISAVGHTPEKDAYIGLILALDMLLSTGKNLGVCLGELQERFGYFYPARGGVTVSQQGETLLNSLARLEKYRPGVMVPIGEATKEIAEVIAIDGRKMIFMDGSWLMIRPSGTEPKVRFYVEARSESGKEALFNAAKAMLAEAGLL
ncbi:phosphoglucomutase [Thiovibrio sp. JS02]